MTFSLFHCQMACRVDTSDMVKGEENVDIKRVYNVSWQKRKQKLAGLCWSSLKVK